MFPGSGRAWRYGGIGSQRKGFDSEKNHEVLKAYDPRVAEMLPFVSHFTRPKRQSKAQGKPLAAKRFLVVSW